MPKGILRAGILVGGQSRRMGRAKALLRVGGQTLAEHLAAIVRPRTTEVVLLGRVQGGEAIPLPVLDDAPGIEGPFAGILGALRATPNDDWLIVATDMPLVTLAAVDWLLSEAAAGTPAVLPRTRAGMPEPLFAIYAAAIRPTAERLIAAGIRSPSRIADEPGVRSPTIPPALEAAWRNTNTPADWTSLLADDSELTSRDG